MTKSENPAPSNSAPRAAKESHARQPGFGEVIRSKRLELKLTMSAVAARIETSKPYVAHLESGNRHPSDKIVTRLASVLGLDNRELFFLANPHAKALIDARPDRAQGSVWERFQKNRQLQHIHKISNDEMEVLSGVVLLGEIHSSNDLIYVLNAIRHAVGK